MAKIEGFRVINYRSFAVFFGGSQKLFKQSWQEIGSEKTNWATHIPPFMDVDNNLSPSFCYFRDKLRDLSNQ